MSAVGGLPVPGPLFNESIPFRGAPPSINRVPGAPQIQEWLARIEWRMQPADAAAYAPLLRKRTPPGRTSRPTVIFLARGDQSAALVEASSIVRAGRWKIGRCCIGMTALWPPILRRPKILILFIVSRSGPPLCQLPLLKRTGFVGGSIQREDGAHGTTKQLLAGVA
jgi:hypothetical protein